MRNRREFLRDGGAFATWAVVGSSLWASACDITFAGPLRDPDENGIRMPKGFRSRILARSGDLVAGTSHAWHGAPDGGAVFETTGGWIYVSNSELFFDGGVGALRFDRSGRVRDAYAICSGTRRNCAGGATPWGTWLSCEEVGNGLVFECDPSGVSAPIARPQLGRFNHEAVATDPVERRLYLTEDRGDGRLYRFTPAAWGNLASGTLEVAELFDTDRVRWHTLPNPDPGPGQDATRHQVPESSAFRGGEGIAYDLGHIYFTTKGDNRVWDLDIAAQRIRVLYDRATDAIGQLSGVDNIATMPRGGLVVAEDFGNMELVTLTPSGLALALLRVIGQDRSELAGPAFDPTGTRLYFSSQRGIDGRGITYEVRGPFPSFRRRHSRRAYPA